MKIWAHTLVKNEARWLWYAVNSVIDRVDKLLLWDSGSSDGSLMIEKELKKRYANKIILKERKINSGEDFTVVRQEMLNETESDWFLVLDGDEIWWEESIKKVVDVINAKESIESIFVPTINLVGDIFHYQGPEAGRYKFGNKVGHYNLRAVNLKIPGLHSQNPHGTWGWVDTHNKMIQERGSDKVVFVDAPYLHASFIGRGENRKADEEVLKRSKKFKYEIGENFPPDFYYPEVLFRDKSDIVESPWCTTSLSFKFRALMETPLRKIKRKMWQGGTGY